ncbi:MAG: cob(I)yrinic acid a,c-diamide adenosyltransferase [Oligoflexus sp.]
MRGSKDAESGQLIIYTGQGKGKTTAALGLAFRAMGRQKKVGMVQFLKGKWMTGERIFARDLALLELYVMGEGFSWESEDLSRDKQAAQRAWEKSKELIAAPDVPIIILDEISYAINYDFISESDVLQFIQNRPKAKHVVLTGRHIPDSLIQVADLVTEMQAIKHPFSKGQRAVLALDY